MNSYQQIINDLREKYERDGNVIAMFVTGSVAREEAKQGNDLDLLLVTKEGKEFEEN